MPHFKDMPLCRSQVLLFSQSVDEALPADSDVRGFDDVMDCLDYLSIESKCSDRGCPPYPPKEMVKILCYAYSKGIRSSRRIEELLKFDMRFTWLAGGLKPDHNTIARFRKENYVELTSLFKDSVRICSEAGLVMLNVVATDGTKIAARGSRRRIYDHERLERELAAVDKVLAEAEEIDAAEDASAASSPKAKTLADAKERKARLQLIAQRLRESDRNRVVATEPDARVMLASGQKRPAYNMQATVDAQSQVMVAMTLTRHEVDTGELPAMVEQTEANTGCSPDLTLADCGYCDEDAVRWATETGHEVLMPLREQFRVKGRDDLFSSKCFLPHPDRDVLICPAGRELVFRTQWRDRSAYRQYVASDCQSCSFYRQCVKTKYGSRRVNVNVMAEQRKLLIDKLKSPEGKKLFRLRSQIVEPVFGQIKSNRGFDRFLAWGLKGASAEAAIACLAHNVMKCVRNAATPASAAASSLTAVLRRASAILRSYRVAVAGAF